MRCIELTAFGLAKRTRRSGSSTITPSPTRGASSNSSSSWRNGKVPSAIMCAKRSNSRDVVVLELAELAAERGPRLPRDDRDDRPAVSAPGCTARGRARVEPSSGASPSTISPCATPAATSGRATSSTTAPTRSVGYTVWPVVGRTWASTTNRCRPRPPPGRAAGGRRSRGRPAAATTRPAAARGAAPRPAARVSAAPARTMRWSPTASSPADADPWAKRCSPMRASPATSAMSDVEVRARSRPPRGGATSSARSSASRRATTS